MVWELNKKYNSFTCSKWIKRICNFKEIVVRTYVAFTKRIYLNLCILWTVLEILMLTNWTQMGIQFKVDCTVNYGRQMISQTHYHIIFNPSKCEWSEITAGCTWPSIHWWMKYNLQDQEPVSQPVLPNFSRRHLHGHYFNFFNDIFKTCLESPWWIADNSLSLAVLIQG